MHGRQGYSWRCPDVSARRACAEAFRFLQRYDGYVLSTDATRYRIKFPGFFFYPGGCCSCISDVTSPCTAGVVKILVVLEIISGDDERWSRVVLLVISFTRIISSNYTNKKSSKRFAGTAQLHRHKTHRVAVLS